MTDIQKTAGNNQKNSLTSNANVYSTFGKSVNVFETSELTLTLLYCATHCTLISFFPGVVNRQESG